MLSCDRILQPERIRGEIADGFSVMEITFLRGIQPMTVLGPAIPGGADLIAVRKSI